MEWQPVNLGLRSNPERVNDDGAAAFVNCYPEEAGEEGRFRFPVYACDGFSSVATLSRGGPVRGMFNLNDTSLIVVSGTRIQTVTTAWSATDLGPILTARPCTMAQNSASPNNEVAIVSEDGQFFIVSNGVATDVGLVSDIPKDLFTSVAGLDNYFILTASNGEIWKTELGDGDNIDALDFATAAANPDGLTRGVVRARDFLAMGPRSTEFWTNTGATDFPLERQNTVNVGIYAGATAVPLTAVMDGSTAETVCWVANNMYGDMVGVMLLGGYEPRKVSSPVVDRAIRDADKTTLKAFTYTRAGTTFYTLTSSTWTWELNTRTLSWHKRTSTGLDVWRISDACAFNGATIFGDYQTGALYEASATLASSSAVTCDVRQSLNGGATWSPTRSKPVGDFAETRKKVQYTRMGQAKEDGRVLEITLANAIVENGVDTDMIIRPPALHAWPNRTRLHRLRVMAGANTSGTAKGVLGASMIADGQEA